MTASGELDPRLLPLVAAPFPRAAYMQRVRSLIDRYRALLSLSYAQDPREREHLTMRLLRDHPSALLEQASVAQSVLEARLHAAEQELSNLKAAAPLPAPIERNDRTEVLAVADVEHFMRELRYLRRRSRRLPPDMLIAAYRSADPLELSADLVRAIAMIPRGTLLRIACALAGTRHGVADLRALLAPPRPKERAGGLVFVCKQHELPEGGAKKVEAFGRTVAVFRDRGTISALDDSCPHRGGPLHMGDLEGGAVICPLHGWAFDLASGKMRGNPRVIVPCYEVKIEGDDILVGPRKSS